MRNKHGLLILMALSALVAFSVQAQVVVVVGSNSSAAGMSKEQVANIFLGKSTALTPLDQPESSPLREEFYTKVTGKSAAQMKAHWSRMAFTGRGMPPKEGASSDDIKKILSRNPAMIGYIEKSAVDGSVKTILAP
jgi:ABC-type phosphate transport system substrate-binding protein